MLLRYKEETLHAREAKYFRSFVRNIVTSNLIASLASLVCNVQKVFVSASDFYEATMTRVLLPHKNHGVSQRLTERCSFVLRFQQIVPH